METEARIGQVVLDRYRPQSVIGSGGSGILYRARDLQTGRDVALKLLRAGASAAAAAPQRWQREAAATRALHHPNIVRVLDAGEHLGQPCVVMELLEGRTLEAHLALRGALPPVDALELMFPLIGALAVAHEHGLVHRDLTPANVLLAEQDGTIVPKLLDFGLAKHANEGAITQSGQALGTPGFMSPEQARGAEITAASDLWALGALLYVCVTGRLPFAPDAVKHVRAPLLAAAPLARAPLLLPVIERALEWEPNSRFPHARAFAHALMRTSQLGEWSLPDDPDPIGLPEWRNWRAELSRPGADTVTLLEAQVRTLSHFGPVIDAANTGAAPARSVALPEPGSVLVGRFRLVRILGNGAMGTVFEAIDQAPGGGPIALKVLHRLDATAVYRLKHEFRALADVTHPNLVALHELFADESGRWFFTMELVNARHFDQFVRSGSDGDAGVELRLRELLPQLARAVRHLHGLGRIHRDLKPSNVLVTPQGRLVVVDFGLTAARMHARTPAHFERGFQGTPAYAAPEQSEASGALPASDWYAIGVMLYEALTGRLPFQGTREGIMRAKREQSPTHPAQLGAAGSEDLLRLCMQLLERDPNQRAAGSDILALSAGSQPELHETQATPFVGRTAEIAQLTQAFERATQGQKVAVLIGGPSGIGKTTLVESFVSELARKQRVHLLAGRCYAYEALPYKAFDGVVDALTAQLSALPADVLAKVLPADVAMLAQLFPVLRRVEAVATLPVPSLSDERGLRQRALSALKLLLGALAEYQPLIVFVDDLQWGDLDSAQLIRELFSEPNVPAVLFVGTYRDEHDAGSPLLAELLDPHGTMRHAERIALGPLPQSAIEALAAELLGSDRDHASLRDIARNAGGHPMLASELARFARDHGSATLPERVSLPNALRARLAELPRESRAVLQVVCVAGRRLPREFLFRAVPDADLSAMRQLRLGHATRETWLDDAFHIEPYHDQIRELVIRELPEAELRATHSNLARHALEFGDFYLDLAVDSLVGAGREGEAGALAERAAARAHAVLAFNRAADLLGLALAQAEDEREAQRLCIACAEACVRAGRSLRAAELFDRASARSTGQQRFDLRREAMTQYLISGHKERGSQLLLKLGDEIGMPLAERRLPSDLYMLGHLARSLAGFPRLREPRAVQDPRARRDRERLRVIWAATTPLIHLESRMATRYIMQAVKLAAEYGERAVYAQASSLYWSGMTSAIGRRVPAFERQCTRARELVEAHGDRWEIAMVQVSDGGRALLVSDIPAALEHSVAIATAQDARTALGISVQTSARSLVLPALFWSGRLSQFCTLADRWIAEARDCGDRHLEATFRFTACHRYLRTGDLAAALDSIEKGRALALDYVHPSSYDVWWEGGILMYEGRVEDALAHCARMRFEFLARSRLFAQHKLSWMLFVGLARAELAARGIDREASMRVISSYITSTRISICRAARQVGTHLAGTLAWVRGQRDDAFRILSECIDIYDAFGLRLTAASLRWRLAELGHPRATEYERVARALFAEEGIEQPERWAAMFAPGLRPDAARHA